MPPKCRKKNISFICNQSNPIIMKSFLATIILTLVMACNSYSQETYQYAQVTLSRSTNGNFVSISKADGYQETKIPMANFKSTLLGDDVSPLLAKVNELAKDGWEVWRVSDYMASSSSTASCMVYFMRKKL